jgi:diketogulonate reductase-like aldo/keto reductase
VTEAFEQSLGRLGLDYIDLYLIHWPAPQRAQAWKVMEGLAKEGRVKSIGVSNFTIRHLEELLGVADTVPAVNQVELHPFLYQKELIEYCQQHSIVVEAYSPLARANKFDHPTLIKLAESYGRSPAQIMLRWCLQHDLVPLPKATSERHIADNFAALGWELDGHDMLLLDNLHEGFRVTKDPEAMP